MTLTEPAEELAGVTPVRVVPLTTEMLVAETFPNSKDAPVWKLDPRTVTDVPPAAGPEVGLIEVMLGVWADPMADKHKIVVTTTNSFFIFSKMCESLPANDQMRSPRKQIKVLLHHC